MIFLGKWPSEMTHEAVILAVLWKLITLVVLATSPTFQFSRVFTATFLQCTLLNKVRAAAKISAGSVGSPYNQLYTVSTLPLTKVVKISNVE